MIGKTGKNNPLISIIVPVYNVEPYIERCIESIIKQSYKNIEIVVVDDGSTDNSGRICDEYAQKDRRIKVIHKRNGGLVSARKVGVINSAGDYVAYVDGDDWIEQHMYKILIRDAVQYNADIVTSGLYRDYENSVISEFDNISEGIYDTENIKKKIFPVMIYTGRFFESGINIHLYNKIYRRKLVETNQLNIDDCVGIGEDAALVYPCIIDSKKIVVKHRCFYHYCIRQNSIMSLGYKKEISGYKRIYGIIEKKIELCSGWENILKEQLNYLMIYLLLLKEPEYVITVNKGMIIPFEHVQIREKIVLYGSGKFGNTLYRFVKEKRLCEIVLRIDESANVENEIFHFTKLKEISESSYEKVVIAVLVNAVAEKIFEQLIGIGIKEYKIVRLRIDSKKIVRSEKWKSLFKE